MRVLIVFVSFLVSLVAAASPIPPVQPQCDVRHAVCRFENASVGGTVDFYMQTPTSPVTITGQISGLQPGLHGFHVHQYGDLSNGCTSAGPHFNPFNREHGAPQDENRHIGDLGNIEANRNGVADVQITDSQLRLCGPISIIGRALMVHAAEDDLGRGGNEESKRTGNAGARLGCCIIGVSPN